MFALSQVHQADRRAATAVPYGRRTAAPHRPPPPHHRRPPPPPTTAGAVPRARLRARLGRGEARARPPRTPRRHRRAPRRRRHTPLPAAPDPPAGAGRQGDRQRDRAPQGGEAPAALHRRRRQPQARAEHDVPVRRQARHLRRVDARKGVLPERHPQHIGCTALSANDIVHVAVEHADLILNIGHDVVFAGPPFTTEPTTTTR